MEVGQQEGARGGVSPLDGLLLVGNVRAQPGRDR